MENLFPKVRPISKIAQHILEQRYFNKSLNETKWEDIVNRVVDNILDGESEDKELTRQMILNTYFVPNSPCLVNAGKDGAGLSACVPGHTRIPTENGLIRIKDIVEHNVANYAFDGTRRVQIFGGKNSGKKKIKKIYTERGHLLELTDEHRVLVYNTKNSNASRKWKYVKDLTVGDILEFSNKGSDFPKNVFDKKLAILLGYLYSDGCFTIDKRNNSRVIEFVVNSMQEAELIKKINYDFTGEDNLNLINNETYIRLRGYGTDRYKFLEKFQPFYGNICNVPNEIFQSNKESISSFLSALFSADGSFILGKKSSTIELSMSNESFIRDVGILLEMYGIRYSISRYIDKRTNYSREEAWKICILDKHSISIFEKEIGFFSPEKSEKLKSYLNNKPLLETQRHKNNLKLKVIKICDGDEYVVYDIQTESEKFLANNFVVHNCYVVDFPDTIEGIFRTKLDFALIARKGGGCGTSLTKIRPEGDPVHGSTHGYAGGPIKFADTISHDMDALTQAGFRSMAIMLTMSIYHPDILKFITAKAEEGKFANANISVMVDDAFMRKVENGETFWTEFGGKKYKEYDARTVFNLIIEGAYQNGEPGLLFQDAINNSPYSEVGQEISATNPCSEQPLPANGVCLDKDSLLITDNGIRKINSVTKGKTVSSSNNLDCIIKDFTAYKTGNKKVLKTVVDGGATIITTPEHVFITNKGEIQAKDLLEKNAKIKWMSYNPLLDKIDIDNIENRLPILLGWMHGDGWATENSVGISFNNKDGDYEVKDKILDIYHEYFGTRKPLKNDDISYQEQTDNTNAFKQIEEFGINLGKSNNKEIPDIFYSWNIRQQLSFLKALFTADGVVSGKNNSQIIYYTSSYVLAEEIQNILSSIGIQSRKIVSKFSSKRKDQIKITISKESARRYMDYIGFLNDYKSSQFNENAKRYKDETYLSIISQEYLDEPRDVYDFTIENTHVGYVNGILVHNCNLGSLDLTKFVDKDSDINIEKLTMATKLAVRFLDAVIDKTSYPTEDIREWSLANRPIGLGLMGYADYLLMMKIAYGSEEALNKLEYIMSVIKQVATRESEILGLEKGIPTECQKLAVPRRNITLLTVAPTGTISILAGCSSSIEPVFSEITVRNDKTGSYTFENNLADADYFRCAVSSNGATEVTWEEHIRTLASAQKYVDSGVSKTANFPTHVRRETMAKAAILAWKLGCKGVAMYRNNSRRDQVLSPKNLKAGKCPVCGNDLVEINNKKICVNCKQPEQTVGSYDD